MSGPLYISCKTSEKGVSAKLQLLPCEIEHNGGANVENYFNAVFNQVNESPDNSTENVKDLELHGVFRGHPLKGQEKFVPIGYKGLVIKEHRPVLTEEEERNLTITEKFDSFIYWNWDLSPSSQDKVHKAMEWIEISNSIHEPVLL